MTDQALNMMSDWDLANGVHNAMAEVMNDRGHYRPHVTKCLDGLCDNPDCPFADALAMMTELAVRQKRHSTLRTVQGMIEEAIDSRQGLMCSESGDGELEVQTPEGFHFKVTIQQTNADEDV